jgi:hypothetical protein
VLKDLGAGDVGKDLPLWHKVAGPSGKDRVRALSFGCALLTSVNIC